MAVTWGIGVTVFRGALVDRGLPEVVADATQDQQAQWVYGSQLADLGHQAAGLATLAETPEISAALTDLSTSLSQGAALLGELRFEDQGAVALAESYSPEALETLTSAVAALSSSVPSFEEPDMPRGETLARIAFQINSDARNALSLADEEQAASLPNALSAGGGTSDQGSVVPPSVACLTDHQLLEGTNAPEDPALVESVGFARALDRGYALDYTLQLNAARSSKSSAKALEQQRIELNTQLRTLRSALPDGCADLRSAAYDLPENGLEALDEAASHAAQDYADALVTAAGNLAGERQASVASIATEVLIDQQKALDAHPLLTTASE